MATSAWEKFRLLLWKNYILQKRHIYQTLLEILLPLVFVVLLVLVRDAVNSEKYDGMEFGPWSPTNVSESRIESVICSNAANLYYVPLGTEADDMMTFVKDNFFKDLTAECCTGEICANVTKTSTMQGFKTEDEIVEAYITGNKILAAVVFTNTDTAFEYSLRLPFRMTEITNSPVRSGDQWFTELVYPIFQVLGPRAKGDHFGGPPGYHSQGFLYLQYALDAAIANHVSGGSIPLSDNKWGNADVLMQRFPYPAFIDDVFLLALQAWLPLILMLSYIYPVINTCKSIVLEKERKLKESMKMMGLPNWMHWSAWFLKSFILLLLSTIFMIIFLKVRWKDDGLAVITHSDGSVLFVFLLVFSWSAIALAFFISTLFSKANSGAAAAGIIWFMSYFPYFFLQPRYDQLSRGAKTFSGILPNTGMAFGFQIIAMWEGTGARAQWSNFAQGTSPQDEFTLLDCTLILLADGVLYLLLAFYIEAVWPGEYGVPLPSYFPFMKSYWTGSSGDDAGNLTNGIANGNNINSNPFIEAPPADAKAGIRIKGLTKSFGDKTAVNHLNLDMYENQITSLLGHNGAGKTTTMSMLTGLFPPSSGTAIVNGFDIRTSIKEVRDSLGLCPQHDILFDEMTVEEHLTFFCLLKGYPNNVKSEVDRMLNGLGLEPKRTAQSRALSGGMKRKLSVGIALIGGSKIVLLDEPTSGMDPGARRATWDLLTSEKKNRTIVLSTHFMDEADLLGDRIAVMCDGELQTVGSSLFLKKKYGGGYHLVIVKDAECDPSKITAVLRSFIGDDVEVEQDVGAELSYSLPDEKAGLFAGMFEELERRKEELRIDSYGASLTTMEQVFIRVGRAAEERKTAQQNGSSHKVTIEALQSDSDDKYKLYEKLDKNAGFALLWQQFYAMLVKKGLYALRNRALILVQATIPVAFLIATMIMLETLPGFKTTPLKINLKSFDGTVTPVACDANSSICKSYESYAKETGTVVKHVDDLDSYVVNESAVDISDFNHHQIIGMKQTSSNLTAMFNAQPLHSPAVTLNYLTNALLRSAVPNSVPIIANNHPLPFTIEDESEMVGTYATYGFQVGFNLCFGMSFLVSGFVLFLIRERESKAKHLQFVSGASFWVFWLANFLVDFVNYLVPSLLLMGVMVAFQADTLDSAGVQGIVFVIFLFYGWAIIPAMYLFSFGLSVPSSGFTKMLMINLISGLGPFVAISILQIPQLDLQGTAKVLDWIFMLSPNYNLGWGINTLGTNVQLQKSCPRLFQFLPDFCAKADNEDNYCCTQFKPPNGYGYLAWQSAGIGRNILFLFLVGTVCWMAILVSESKILSKLLRSKSANQRVADISGEVASNVDADVAAEASRIRNTNLTQLFKTENLVVRDLHKTYGSFAAVQSLNLGVQQRECFGLLGVNGAGKTTTFKILTGDLPATSGDAFICGHSINSDIKRVQRNLGYCPQFDALIEELTGRETIRLFARLRGVKEEQIDGLVDRIGANLLFTEHLEKPCGTYSGGNKRKLSTALALVGNPPVLFLDEPTTGMDPVARRRLWNCISKVREMGTSIVLTSHSMEECEALCTRLAIMVNGEFRCLGATQHLKSKFGQGYNVIAQMATKTDNNKTSFQESLRRRSSGTKSDWETDIEPLKKFIEEAFAGCVLKDVHSGYVHYHVTNRSLKWSDLFSKMEVAKSKFNLEAYSVGQTSLEQVFLDFTKHQQVSDE